MHKGELRKKLQKARQDLSSEDRQLKSKQICKELEKIDWSGISSLHYYEPITKLGEVDISSFIEQLKTSYPKLHLYTSRNIDGVWEIFSQQHNKIVKPPEFDAVIVPMLGFDASLHRIGYGGGYYDRLLASQRRTKKIGVCFEAGKTERIEVAAHDIALDIVITESTVY